MDTQLEASKLKTQLRNSSVRLISTHLLDQGENQDPRLLTVGGLFKVEGHLPLKPSFL